MYIYVMSMSKFIFRFFVNFFGAKPEMDAPGVQICPSHRIRSHPNEAVTARDQDGGSGLPGQCL